MIANVVNKYEKCCLKMTNKHPQVIIVSSRDILINQKKSKQCNWIFFHNVTLTTIFFFSSKPCCKFTIKGYNHYTSLRNLINKKIWNFLNQSQLINFINYGGFQCFSGKYSKIKKCRKKWGQKASQACKICRKTSKVNNQQRGMIISYQKKQIFLLLHSAS